MKTCINHLLAAATIAFSSRLAQAHDGHGLTGSHWHATDSWGFVGLAIALSIALWFYRGGK